MKKLVPIPENTVIETQENQMSIKIPWYKHIAWFLLFFAMFWDGFLFFAASSAPASVVLFMLLHIGVGVAITWYTICLFVNQTIININHDGFSISTTPLLFPGFGDVTVHREEFSQIYVKEKVRNNRRSTSVTYTLSLLDNNGRTRSLPFSCDDPEQALFIKDKIESYMDIKRMEVEGEYI
jgi:hypothetical protein